MVSIGLDGIDEATSRGVAELKKELAKPDTEWPDEIIAGGRRGGKSGMMSEAIKRMTGHDVTLKKPKEHAKDAKALLDWDLRASKIYQRPEWAGAYHGALFDGTLEFLIPDTIMGKSVDAVNIKSREEMTIKPGIEVELRCRDIEVQCLYINDDDPRLILIGFSEYRDMPPSIRSIRDGF